MAKTKDDKPAAQKSALPDPLSMIDPKKLGLRIGGFLVVVWVVATLITKWWAFAAAGVVTVATAGVVVWTVRNAQKARAVQSLLVGADTPEARKDAMRRLETEFKKGDPQAAIARAQLLAQEDPQRALAVLEEVDLSKVMPPTADEVRATRALIHLSIGDVQAARVLADAIELSRQQHPKSRAMVAAVVGEAWARTGQAKKAYETLSVFDPDDPELADLRPLLFKALAFTHAGRNDAQGVNKALYQLMKLNPQLLGAFFMPKVHPILQREAKVLLEKSGMVPRKQVVRRM